MKLIALILNFFQNSSSISSPISSNKSDPMEEQKAREIVEVPDTPPEKEQIDQVWGDFVRNR